MTVVDVTSGAPPEMTGPVVQATPADGTPRRGRHVTTRASVELVGSALSAFFLVWLIFTIAGVSAPFGFLVSWYLLFILIYGVVCRVLHGVLAAKDQLATVVIWSGAAMALVPLAGVIGFTFLKGIPVAFAHFPHFFLADMSQLTADSPVTQVGAGAAIVGPLPALVWPRQRSSGSPGSPARLLRFCLWQVGTLTTTGTRFPVSRTTCPSGCTS
jgi:phosphate transport system permease protein